MGQDGGLGARKVQGVPVTPPVPCRSILHSTPRRPVAGTATHHIRQGISMTSEHNTTDWAAMARRFRLADAGEDMLAALQLIYANAGESPEWIRERIAPAIAKAEGR